MHFEDHKHQILNILVENLKNPQPQVVGSEKIADKLNMHIADTRNLLKVLHQNGVVITDLEGRYSLITADGLSWLEEKHYLKKYNILNGVIQNGIL